MVVDPILCWFNFSQPFQILHAQNQAFELQSGLIHYYFNNDPVLNLNYPYKSKGLRTAFRGLLNDSYGFQYRIRFTKDLWFSLDYSQFGTLYNGVYEENFDRYPLIESRRWKKMGMNILYERKITPRWSAFCGGGLLYRQGVENLIAYESDWVVYPAQISYKDVGISLSLKPCFSLNQNWFLFSAFIYHYFFIPTGKKQVRELNQEFASLGKNFDAFPAFQDLSFHLGIGFQWDQIK